MCRIRLRRSRRRSQELFQAGQASIEQTLNRALALLQVTLERLVRACVHLPIMPLITDGDGSYFGLNYSQPTQPQQPPSIGTRRSSSSSHSQYARNALMHKIPPLGLDGNNAEDSSKAPFVRPPPPTSQPSNVTRAAPTQNAFNSSELRPLAFLNQQPSHSNNSHNGVGIAASDTPAITPAASTPGSPRM